MNRTKGCNVWKFLMVWFLSVSLLLSVSGFSMADELDETRRQKEQKEQEAQKKQQELYQAKQYEGTLASQLSQMSNDLYKARASYQQALASVAQKEEEIAVNEKNITEKEIAVSEQTTLLYARVRALYKESHYSPLLYLFLSKDFNELNSQYIYKMAVISQDKEVINELRDRIYVLSTERLNLEGQKQQLVTDKSNLEVQKQQLEAQEVYLNSQISSLKNTQSQLANQLSGINNQIASLSAKEQQILAAKAAAAAASTSVGSKEQNGSTIALPPPQKSSGDFYSFWSYGFPHRVGMNQYGAYGRAIVGQTTGIILHAYFANTAINGLDNGTSLYSVPKQIKVQGYGWIDFEDLYLKGIGEMPSSWPMEALKSQAIAARTYALAYINYSGYVNYDAYRNDSNVREICTTQECQVFIGHIKDERWAQAVTETKGMVMTSGGVPITAYYASTAGGSTLSSQEVWGGYRAYALGLMDVDGKGKPYDGPDYGNSPWYHKSWGDHPWLSKAEVEDMANAALLPESYNSKLPAAPNGFTSTQVVETLKIEGITVIENLKAVEVVVGPKQTESFRVYFNDTYVNIEPERFRFAYNLRSPGTNAIWSSRFDIQTN